MDTCNEEPKFAKENAISCAQCGTRLRPGTAVMVSDGARVYCATTEDKGVIPCASLRLGLLQTMFDSADYMLDRFDVPRRSSGLFPDRALNEINRLRNELSQHRVNTNEDRRLSR